MKEKILVIILVILLLLLSVIVYFKINNSNDDIKKDDGNRPIIYVEDLTKKVEFNGLIFSNVSLEKGKDNTLNFTVKVSNNTNDNIEISSFDVLFRDNKDKLLKRITAYGGIVKSDTSFIASSSINVNLDKIYSLEFVGSESFSNYNVSENNVYD